MTYIKEFTLTAPKRVNDLHPFVSLKIREAATPTGSYSIIDTQAWSDATPSTVSPTPVETTLATLEDGWYQFQWVDGTGAVTQWWGPVSSSASELFTIQEALDAIGDQAFDTSKIVEARTYAQQELERALGYSLLPVTVSDQVLSVRSGQLRLEPYARDVTALTVAGTSLSADQLAALTVHANGTVYPGYRTGPAGWPDGYANTTVSYTYGLETLPFGAKRAGLALALDYLGQAGATGSVIDPRATTIVTDDGTIKLDTGGRFAVKVAEDFVRANRALWA